MRTLLVFSLAALTFAGCDKDEAKKKAQESLKTATSTLSQEYEESKVVAYAQQFVDSVESRDMASLKRLCVEQADGDYKAIMTCYYNAFVIENDQGVDATRKYLADEMAKEGNSPVQKKAVSALNEYFAAKGSLRTKEVAALILMIGLEAKYPHGGGKVGKLIAEKLGLMPPSETTQPATTNSSKPALGG